MLLIGEDHPGQIKRTLEVFKNKLKEMGMPESYLDGVYAAIGLSEKEIYEFADKAMGEQEKLIRDYQSDVVFIENYVNRDDLISLSKNIGVDYIEFNVPEDKRKAFMEKALEGDSKLKDSEELKAYENELLTQILALPKQYERIVAIIGDRHMATIGNGLKNANIPFKEKHTINKDFKTEKIMMLTEQLK